MVSVRGIKQSDKEEIRVLGTKLFREGDEIPFLNKALNQYVSELSFVAVDKGSVIGFIVVCEQITNAYCDFLNKIPNCYEIAFLGVSPIYQGCRLGTRLLEKSLVAIFERSRHFTCWLLVDKINKSAIRLYEKLGFRKWIETEEGKTVIPGYIMGLSHRRYSDTLESDEEYSSSLQCYGMPLVSV
jgi:ribosomal protein S18 acetylase RimI-like enzyme